MGIGARKLDRKSRARSGLALDPDLASMRARNLAYKIEPEPHAAKALQPGRALETLKDPILVRLSDPDAVVLNHDPKFRVRPGLKSKLDGLDLAG